MRFKDFKHNDELTSFQVSEVIQDNLGFMWMGTNNGLLRYDGYELKKYLSPEGRDFGINEASIYKLYIDHDGQMWISLNSNICYYNHQSDSIKIVANTPNLKGLYSAYISNYAENSKSVLHVSDNNVIYMYKADLDTFINVFKVDRGTVSKFFFDKNDNLWISCLDDGGIYFFNTSTKQYQTLEIPEHLITNRSVSDLVFHRDILWIATANDGVITFNPENSQFKKYPTHNEYELNIRSFYVDRDDFLWMIDFTGLKLHIADRDFFQGYYPSNTDDFSIKPYINKIFQDKEHNYWTTHYPGGIGFAPKPLGIIRFNSKIDSPFRLNVDNLSTIAEDGYGNLWMGNPFNGIDVFKWEEGRTAHYGHDTNNPHSLGKGATQVIYKDSEQRMWVGSYWGGLQKYQPESDDFISYLHDPSNPSSISANDIRAIAEDTEGNLWLVTHGKGVDQFNPNTGQFINFNSANSMLSNDYAFDIIIDLDGSIWVGTVWGVSILRKGKKAFENYYFDEYNNNSITSNSIYTVYADSLNRLWVGTNKGLNLYQPESNNFIRYVDGFANINIVSITSDNENNIWVGTFSGISRLNPKTGKILNLNKDDGLISNNFTPRAVLNNGKNTLFFGSNDGLNYFNPEDIQINYNPPKVYISKFKVFNHEIDLHNSDNFTKNIIVSEQVKLNYNQKVIDIEFSALNYNSTEKNNYAYYLEGFEKEWNYSGNKRTATYTNLKPGKYIFRAKASNNEGTWNELDTQIKIEIAPPFWGTIWFKIITIILIIAGSAGYIYYRERTLVKNNTVLENQVTERTKEIIEQNIQLEFQKQELEKANQLKNRFFNILAHDLRSPISSLVQLTGLLQEQNNLGQSPEPKAIDAIANTSVNVMKLLEDLLLWGKSQTDNINLVFEKINLIEIVNEAIESYQEYAIKKSILVHIQIPNNIHVMADANTLKVIIRNLVSNAIKFSFQKNKVEIACIIDHNEAIVSIKDHGTGMSNHVINDFIQGKIKYTGKGTLGETGTGFGLSICKEMVELNKGKIRIESIEGKGTTFFFTIPLAH